MNRRKFLKAAALWVPAFPAIVKAQSSLWEVASSGVAAAGGGSSISFVQDAIAQWFGGSGTTESTGAVTVTAGHLLVVAVAWQTSGSTISSISGNSNTFTLADSLSDATYGTLDLYYVKNCNGGSTQVTVTWSSDPGFGYISLHEVAGASTTAPLDQHHIATPANPPISSGNVTTTTSGQYVFGASFDGDGSSALTAGAGFTIPAHSNTSFGATEYQLQSASGTTASTFASGAPFQYYITGVATYK